MPPVSLGFTPVTRRPYDAPLLRGVDGDTVNIDQSVRMVSIDTPESRLGGAPATAQATLDRCRARLEAGEFDEIDQPLRQHLLDRLTPDAAERHLARVSAPAPSSTACAPSGWRSTRRPGRPRSGSS